MMEEETTTKTIIEGGGDEGKVRIFVGGLGESVRSEDLRQIFSKLGRIEEEEGEEEEGEGVEIIRSKGRSFAYVDFLPSSPKSLSKLFSTYNGCVWKGGKLRLEKAKQHYLARLKHEWAQDAAQLSTPYHTVDVNNNTRSSRNPNKELVSQTDKLRIFFPRLRKVKSIPVGGTGKHKYSFRRVEVPSLPTHFCDCEEHSGHPDAAAEEKQIPIQEEQDAGMNEEELSMMNHVMKKLFERENVSNTACGEIEVAKEGNNSIEEIDDLQPDEGDANTDDDNLIINVVSRGQERISANEESRFNKRQLSKGGPSQEISKKQRTNTALPNMKMKSVLHEGDNSIQVIDNMLLNANEGDTDMEDDNVIINIMSQGQELVSANQESRFNKGPISKDGPTQEMPKEWRKNTASPNKKSKSDLHEENDRIESISAIPHGRHTSEAHSNGMGTVLGAQLIEPEIGVKQLTPSLSWSQKSSWRELVGERSNSAFSISDILLGMSSRKEEQCKSGNVPNSVDSENKKLLGHENQKDQLDNMNGVQGLAEDWTIEQDSMSNKSGRGSAWLHNSSWTQLIGRNNSSSFSITQILPGATFGKQEPAKLDGMKVANSTDSRLDDMFGRGKGEGTAAGTTDLGIGKEDNAQSTQEMSQQIVVGHSDASAPAVEKKRNSATKQTCSADVAIGETCSFMRTVASLKEWANIKAALSGSRKRKK